MADTSGFTYAMFNDLCNPNFSISAGNSLTKTIKNFNGSAYNGVATIMKDSVFSVGASLLVIFMLIEFISIITRISSDGGIKGIQIPANILMKFAILAFLFCHCSVILVGIQEVAVEIAVSVNNNLDINFTTVSTVNEMWDKISQQGFLEKIYINIFIVLEWLILQGIMITINTLMYFRLFELWTMVAFSPIPLSTIASSEFKGVCFNFLISFAAVLNKSSKNGQ